MSDPIYHHYLAVFYLSRWAGEDGKICRFSRPYGDKVVSKRVPPQGTAFEKHLYSMHASDGPPKADMESGFMSHLDSEAADALELLEKGLPESRWESRSRSAWSRFVWAQTMRTPPDIEQLKVSVRESWREEIPHLQARYEELFPVDAPEKVLTTSPPLIRTRQIALRWQ